MGVRENDRLQEVSWTGATAPTAPALGPSLERFDTKLLACYALSSLEKSAIGRLKKFHNIYCLSSS